MNDLLEQAKQCLEIIDAKYEDADINEKLELKGDRDAAYSEYHRARRIGIQAARQLTDVDHQEMADIKSAIQTAANNQAAVGASIRLAKLLKTIV